MKVSVVISAGGSFCCNYATDLCIYLTVSEANMWVTIFNVIMQMGVSVAIMQVVFSAVHYAHGCVYCNYAGEFPL